MDLLKILKALSDPNRLRILNLVLKRELCVCEIEEVMHLSQTNASRHLNKLREAGLIASERRGQFIFYQVQGKTLKAFPFVDDLLKRELKKLKQVELDSARLQRLRDKNMLCSAQSCCLK